MCVLLIRRQNRCSEYFRKVQKIHETKLDLICFYALDMFLPGLPKRVQLKKKKSLRGGEGNVRARARSGALDNNRLLDRRL